MDDIVSQYKKGLEQLKQTKEFLIKLDPVDFELKAIMHNIDQKINKTEQTIYNFQKVPSHRCGLCDRSYDEDHPKAVGGIKVCPYCRDISNNFRSASELEKEYNLSPGTIKRDSLPKEGNEAKLQAYLDCGLVYKTGAGYVVHKIVMTQYYEGEYKRRRKRSLKEENTTTEEM
ncbi:hypothetical protein [Paenibacillus polymyxa]|uniref:Uncharacterized protein n=1 Tax=Paenibacillus polymyxa (strain SC2) TaxID=886882 RepID=E3EKN3_PAEPS|nr:hypothetical protein [Paenibacillus polymyxa]ADO59484.1 hypothetical protein PPSC2_27660 [Paenibacillus polymyxa SC2]WPQ59678.1 hypothetical protein SKN87_28890 [Paenibacillus polymyxa]